MVTSGASGANKNTVLSIKTVPDIGVGGGATTNDITYEKYVDVANAIVTYLEQHPDTPFNYTTINGLTVEQFKNKVFTDLKKHKHINKDLLDTITVSFVSKYDSKQNAIGYTPLDANKKNTTDGYVGLSDKGTINKNLLPSSYKVTGKFIVVPTDADIENLDKNTIDVGSVVWVEHDNYGNPLGLVCVNKDTNPIKLIPFMEFIDTSNTYVQWDDILNKPNSDPYDITSMVSDSHEHLNKAILDELNEIDGAFKYKLHHIICNNDRARVFIKYTHEFDLDVADTVTSTILIPPYKHRKTNLYRVEYGGIKLVRDKDYTFNEHNHNLTFLNNYKFNGEESIDIMLYMDVTIEKDKTLYTIEDILDSNWKNPIGTYDVKNTIPCYNPSNKKLFLFPKTFKSEASPVTPSTVIAIDITSFSGYNTYNINAMFPQDGKEYTVLKALYCDHLDRMFVFIAEATSLDFKIYAIDTNLIGNGMWNQVYSSESSSLKFIDTEDGVYKLGAHYFKDTKKFIIFRNSANDTNNKEKLCAISDDCVNWQYNTDTIVKKPLKVDCAAYTPKFGHYVVATKFMRPGSGLNYVEAYESSDGINWRMTELPNHDKCETFIVTNKYFYNINDDPNSRYIFRAIDFLQRAGQWQFPDQSLLQPGDTWRLPVYIPKWDCFVCCPKNDMKILAFSKTMNINDGDSWHTKSIDELQNQNKTLPIVLGDNGVAFCDLVNNTISYPIIPE